MTRKPALVLLLLAPFFGEVLSTATRPLELVQPWNLALMVALYGCGALLCREVAHRAGLGRIGLLLLAAAYAVYEEALVDRYWFDAAYGEKTGIGDYSRVGGLSVLTATHLTAFHVVVSVGASIVVVERLFPGARDRRWVGLPGLVVAGVALLTVLPLLGEQFAPVGAGQIASTVGVIVALVVAAFAAPRTVVRGPPPRAPGWTAFGCTAAHFVLTYTVADSGLPWPAGVALALAPVVVGVALLWRCPDPLRPLIGVLVFFALLDIAVGLVAGWDLSVAGLAVLAGLWWLRRREAAGVVAESQG